MRITLSVTATKFEQVVRGKLIANKVAGRKPDSIRGLARLMAAGDPVRADTFKRSLMKWMATSGPKPSPSSRALVAHHLGVEAAELDDEEDHPVALMVALMERTADAAASKAARAAVAQLRAELALESA